MRQTTRRVSVENRDPTEVTEELLKEVPPEAQNLYISASTDNRFLYDVYGPHIDVGDLQIPIFGDYPIVPDEPPCTIAISYNLILPA